MDFHDLFDLRVFVARSNEEQPRLLTRAAIDRRVDRESLDAADIGTLADKDRLLSWTEALFEVGDVLVHFAEERLIVRSPLLP